MVVMSWMECDAQSAKQSHRLLYRVWLLIGGGYRNLSCEVDSFPS